MLKGLYSSEYEQDSCGVGLIASIDGIPSRLIVELGIEALKAISHRGAVDFDGKTGDGSGIHVELPQIFFQEHVSATGHDPLDYLIAVGMIFLPRTDLNNQEICRCIVESEILKFGYKVFGWRQVPIDLKFIGEKAKITRPEIEQILIANNKKVSASHFENDLFVIRRRIEKKIISEHIKDFYICSLSCRSIIYKGMFLSEQLTNFYPDLLDERFISNFAIFHQRYSTNTFPTWRLAQPFRIIAHNGEINTLKGNINWMKSHEARMSAKVFEDLGYDINDIRSVIPDEGSDSAIFDTVIELLIRAGRSLPMAKCMLIPDSIYRSNIKSQHKDFFSYCNAVIEPWDGPASIIGYGHPWLIAGMDRNGLRPLRYLITKDNLFIAGSESGIVPIQEYNIKLKGRVGPGQLIAINLKEQKIYQDHEIKDFLSSKQPFSQWITKTVNVKKLIGKIEQKSSVLNYQQIFNLQKVIGWSQEDVTQILFSMVMDGKEPTWSVGDDARLPILSDLYYGLQYYFRQNFSQVTNPPIDSIREQSVMSLKTRLGNRGNILEENENQCKLLQFDSPILFNEEFEATKKFMDNKFFEIDCSFDPNNSDKNLASSIEKIRKLAEEAVKNGCEHLILSDKNILNNKIPIPIILATSAVHSYLIKNEIRTRTSLNITTAECLDIHSYAVLIGVGATTINPYLIQETIMYNHKNNKYGELSLFQCLENYKKAVNEGLLKIMSKLGISILSSYRGGYNFEVLGLSRSLVGEYFPGMSSRISGMGLSGIEIKLRNNFNDVQKDNLKDSVKNNINIIENLTFKGFYQYRKNGEFHIYNRESIKSLHKAIKNNSYDDYKKYCQILYNMPPIFLRDLLSFKIVDSIPLEKVQPASEIVKKFVIAAMSHGALSSKAHETLAIAMNRINAKSCSGEGGENPERYKPRLSGDNANSKIKQIASGRFGVTSEYLINCEEIEIKIAQGAKPGEGGQLPGFKVTEEIAKLRYSNPGTTLISPPPHHDIYSIEDLAQLIYDLKQINPKARIGVKLVARFGVGTIAAGIAKAKADVITISSHNGGTGASPLSSIKYAGIPWEMGIAEVHQTLILNGMRERITLRVDGGLKNGRDIIMAALLGAEEFSFGTIALVALGCIIDRQCHKNSCPVGICTQKANLIERFSGKPEDVINLMYFFAEEVREYLSLIGVQSLDEIIGKTHFLYQIIRGNPLYDDLDLNPLLVQADPGDKIIKSIITGRNEVTPTLDDKIIKECRSSLDREERLNISYFIRNIHRSIGAKLSYLLTSKYGLNNELPEDFIKLNLSGSAGQSLGAFAVKGLKIRVHGDANDYVGKGLSGAIIIIRPNNYDFIPHNDQPIKHILAGNAILYGATSGCLFIAGNVGDRFAVRNSGATVVVEGCGSNGCEYMTGGFALVLGSIGDNFAAGMTGGQAFIYDKNKQNITNQLISTDFVNYQKVSNNDSQIFLKNLIKKHFQYTESPFANFLINNWEEEINNFYQVTPISCT